MPAPAFIDIISQHAEEAAFLWILRSQAVHAPNYTLDDLAELETRIEAHLEGLAMAGDDGWDLCAQSLEGGDAGEVFAASILALDSGKSDRLDPVCAAVDAAPETGRGLVSALGWRGFPGTQPVADQLLSSKSPARRAVGIGAYAIHRKDPGKILDDAIGQKDPLLRVRALKAAGELGASGRFKAVEDHFDDEDAACAFWAAWSGTMLGSDKALKQLAQIGESDSPFADRALRLVPRRLSPATAQQWITKLASDTATLRAAAMAAGGLGWPDRVPWLIELMKEPKAARAAGEAFASITGADLALERMEGDEPLGVEETPTDNPEDEDVGMDADLDLPWPKVEAMAAWWQKNSGRYTKGTRYLGGKPVGAKADPGAGHGNESMRIRFFRSLESAGGKPDYFTVDTRGRTGGKLS